MFFTYRTPARPSPSVLRRIAIWNLRLLSSTVSVGQAREIRSSLLTTSPARSIRSPSISSARLPNGTGTPPISRVRSAGERRNGPNTMLYFTFVHQHSTDARGGSARSDLRAPHPQDRKSTRLNSSHSQISYAV